MRPAVAGRPDERGVAAERLRPVQRLVGARQQALGVAGGAQVADPHRRGDRQAARERGVVDRRAQALGGDQRALGGVVGQQPGELLAADAPDGVDRPRGAGDPRGGLGQHAIAGRMAVDVVDRLEVVEVDDDQAQRAAVARAALGLGRQPLAERALVQQPRQPVVRRAVGEHRRRGAVAHGHDRADVARRDGHEPRAPAHHDLTGAARRAASPARAGRSGPRR